MSNGFVTVGHCIEGLPIGQFVWELLLSAFLICFWLGAMNEPTPFAMGLISTDWSLSELSVQAVLAVMSIGNATSLVLFGWLADRYGRAMVMRNLLLLTFAAALFMQGSRTLELTLCARFLIGLCSGGIMAALLPLIAELLPAKGRGFYLTVWCCGRPTGALFAVIISCLLPQMQWINFIFLLMLPALVLYILCRLEVIPESPRFLYLMGKREEGYFTLLDMYDKEATYLPWAPESVSLTSSPDPKEVKAIGLETLHHSDAASTAFLCLIVFLINCASQCLRAWAPMTALTSTSQQNPLALIAFPFCKAHMAGSSGLSLLQGPPDHHLVMVVAQGYMLEICGTVLCAAISSVVSRRWLIRGALFLAACLSFATTVAEGHHMWFSAGPLYGIVLMAQSAAFNFILVYTCERFPTSSRASAVGLVLFFGQVAQLFMPAMGVVLLRHLSEQSVLCTFNSLYLVALLLTFQLPLPSFRERALHDIDEGKAGRDAQRRKRLGVSYQTV